MTGGSLVLCYHAASADWPHALSLPPEKIEQHVASLLRRRFRPVTAAALVSARGRVLHVTFDDAYRSTRPLLLRLAQSNVPATVFACSDYAERPRPLAVPELAAEAARQPRELETMGWEELSELAERGVEIGSHTRTHPHLPQLGDAELRAELTESRAELEDRLARPCRFLAYPYGHQDARVRDAARAAGYTAAFALLDGSVHDPFALPRVDLYPSNTGPALVLKTEPLVSFALAGLKRRAAERALPRRHARPPR
jgi:peptidoglycan/xylan/chitin deacetylase (PgdA/CDA1 family)